MIDYYVRAIESKWQNAVDSLVAIGALRKTEFGVMAVNGAWDYLGPVYRGTGEFTEVDGRQVERTAPVKEGATLYAHANLRTTSRLTSEYFIPKPRNPARVFFGS